MQNLVFKLQQTKRPDPLQPNGTNNNTSLHGTISNAVLCIIVPYSLIQVAIIVLEENGCVHLQCIRIHHSENAVSNTTGHFDCGCY
jgi:hypothetical protein